MEGIAQSLRCIIRGIGFLSSLGNEPERLESAIMRRESSTFDAAWIASFDLIKNSELADADIRLVNSLREEAFKAALAVTGSPDIAGFVSDDFEMIAKSAILHKLDDFTLHLESVYRAGEFPQASANEESKRGQP